MKRSVTLASIVAAAFSLACPSTERKPGELDRAPAVESDTTVDEAAAERSFVPPLGPVGQRSRAAEQARGEIARLVAGMNRAIDTWDGPAYVAPLAQTETMIFLGSDSTELSLGYDAIAPDILEGFARARAGGRSGSYRHTGIWTGATSDGQTGWWVQTMDYGFERDGERRHYPFRISGFAVREAGSWKVYLAHAALPVSPYSVGRLLRTASPGTPLGFREDSSRSRGGPARMRAGLSPGEAGLRELAHALAVGDNAADLRGWMELFLPEPDVQVIGPLLPAHPRARTDTRPYSARGFWSGASLYISDSSIARALPDVGWWYEKGRFRLRYGSGGPPPGIPPGEPREIAYRSTGAAVRRKDGCKIVQWHGDFPVPNDSTDLFSFPDVPPRPPKAPPPPPLPPAARERVPSDRPRAPAPP